MFGRKKINLAVNEKKERKIFVIKEKDYKQNKTKMMIYQNQLRDVKKK